MRVPPAAHIVEAAAAVLVKIVTTSEVVARGVMWQHEG